MQLYVEAALFVYAPGNEGFIEQVVGNPFESKITPVALEEFIDNYQQYLQQLDHVVVAAPLADIKSVITLAMDHGFSVGLLPLSEQKDLRNCYDLPKQFDAALEIALQKDAQVMDVILCNKKILLFNAAIGRLPMIDSTQNIHVLKVVLTALHRCIGMKLLPVHFSTGSGKNITTAASGCMIVQRHERTLASKLISHNSSLTDGMISMVVTAPISILNYFSFLYQTLRRSDQRRKIPTAVGYIKSSQITVETETTFEVSIDGEKASQTPLFCETIPRAVRINVGEKLRESAKGRRKVHERIEVQNLPAGKELIKAANKKIPFFSYASDERFRDLFISLRKDAEIHFSYLMLMVLSTMLAAIGLYQSSSAVVIGAMLLAPLMAPSYPWPWGSSVRIQNYQEPPY